MEFEKFRVITVSRIIFKLSGFYTKNSAALSRLYCIENNIVNERYNKNSELENNPKEIEINKNNILNRNKIEKDNDQDTNTYVKPKIKLNKLSNLKLNLIQLNNEELNYWIKRIHVGGHFSTSYIMNYLKFVLDVDTRKIY